MSVRYRIATDVDFTVLYRQRIDEEGISEEIFDAKTKTWEESEIAAGAFIGFEPSKSISVEEAMKIING